MWGLLEPIHVVTYFAPEARATADALGMRGFWMGYAAQRSAPLGAVGPEIATAAFFGFHPDRLGRALPDAWHLTTPAAALGARWAGRTRRCGGCGATTSSTRPPRPRPRSWPGRPLRAPSARAGCWPRPTRCCPAARAAPGAVASRHHAARAPRRRPHRRAGGARGGPVASHLIKAAAGESDPEVLRTGRKFAEPAWAEGAAALRADGVLTADGRLTEAGRRLHAEIEDATDAAAAGPWHALGDAATTRLAELLAPLAAAVLDSGTLPQPNPVGFVANRA